MRGKNLKHGTVVVLGLLMALLLCLAAIFASGIVFVSAEEDGSFTGYSSTWTEEELYKATNTVTYFYGQFFYIAIMQKYLAFRIEAESCFFPPFYLNKR